MMLLFKNEKSRVTVAAGNKPSGGMSRETLAPIFDEVESERKRNIFTAFW
jgi:hypothetical protein